MQVYIYKRLFLYLSLPLLFFTSYGQEALSDNKASLQDTILFLNGEKIITKVLNASPDEIKIINPSKKNKEITLETERIFSIQFSNGSEKFYYQEDSTIGCYFTVEEMRLFIFGERDAAKAFRSPFTTITSFAIGAASGSIGSLLSFIPPVIYSFVVVAPKVRIKHSTVSNPNYLQYDTYILGYERVARKKKTMNAIKGSAIGLIAGFLISTQIK